MLGLGEWARQWRLTQVQNYLLTYLLHGAEAVLRSYWFSGGQEIPRIL
jgi:hypothetical protein